VENPIRRRKEGQGVVAASEQVPTYSGVEEV